MEKFEKWRRSTFGKLFKIAPVLGFGNVGELKTFKIRPHLATWENLGERDEESEKEEVVSSQNLDIRPRLKIRENSKKKEKLEMEKLF